MQIFACIIQCKLKFWISILIFTFCNINQVYLIILHPNSLVILEKWSILFVTEVFEQPANESPVHNVVAIRELNILITDLYNLSDET